MKLATLLSSAAAVACLAVTAGAASAAVITPAYEFTNLTPLTDDRPFTLGFEFSLSSAETVSALGYTTVGFTSDQQVGIWNSSGTLLTSTTVTTADPVVGHFAWASIPSIVLGPGTYTIGGTYETGLFASGATGVSSIPGFTWIKDEQLYGSGLNLPTESYGSYGTDGIPQVDFSVGPATTGVPEPATWALMLVGVGMAGGALRMARRKAGAVAA
jgi:hypothetical protein